MKNLFKFLLIVFVFSIGIATLFQLTKPSAFAQGGRVPEKATLAEKPPVDLSNVNILAALNDQTKKLLNAVIPSVVRIEGTSRRQISRQEEMYYYFFGGRIPPTTRRATSLGSGFIVSREGHILTNYHVIGGVDRVDVSLNDGRQATAVLVGGDERIDVAVLKIDLPNLTPLPLGDSDLSETGERVFAIGNPFGVLTETVTDGIISAKSRKGMSEFVEFIQTNAVINPGNSGGPLVNIQGEVIGINTQILGDRTGSWQGYGFAIPSNTVKEALNEILTSGRVQRGYLGVSVGSVSDVTPEYIQQLGIRTKEGAIIGAVELDSPAADAQLQEYDVITAIDGKKIVDSSELIRTISGIMPGTEVTLRIERQGRELDVRARLGDFSTRSRVAGRLQSRPSPVPAPPPAPSQGQNRQGPLSGLSVMPLTQDKAVALNLPNDARGVVIQSIAPAAPAEGILRPGDVVETIQNQPVTSPLDFEQMARAVGPGKRVVLGIIRDGQRTFIPLST